MKKHVSRRFRRFAWANEAVSALEYAILTGVIAVGVAAALVAFQEEVTTALTNVGEQVGGVDIGEVSLEGGGGDE